jgi:hypothetical protein
MVPVALATGTPSGHIRWHFLQRANWLTLPRLTATYAGPAPHHQCNLPCYTHMALLGTAPARSPAKAAFKIRRCSLLRKATGAPLPLHLLTVFIVFDLPVIHSTSTASLAWYSTSQVFSQSGFQNTCCSLLRKATGALLPLHLHTVFIVIGMSVSSVHQQHKNDTAACYRLNWLGLPAADHSLVAQ